MLYVKSPNRRPQETDELDALWKSLTKDEQDAVARRLANPVRGKDEQPFRP